MASESVYGRLNWRKLRDTLLNPQVDPALLDEAIARASERQPPPVLWLLGKTQSGKTSVIRALTGSERAEIGNGFQPCTQTAAFYDFPADVPVVRFLDTRGLGEVDYDPAEDIAYCEQQAHLLVVVMKATDQAQQSVVDVLTRVRRRRPDWPVLVVQTCLHEAYPDDRDHPDPWPFHEPDSPAIPADLRRCLQAQREMLQALPGEGAVHWVPVDLTLPEDGFEPVDYGLEALWEGIEATSSMGLQALLRADVDVQNTYSRAAHPHIMGHALAAAGLGALPLVDIALLPTLQVKLLHTLSSIYGHHWNRRTSKEFFGLLGAGIVAGYGLRWAGRSLIKLIPVWGQTAGAVWGASSSAAVTYALGKSACYYLGRKSQGMAVDGDKLRHIYADAFRRGTRLKTDPEPQDEASE